MRFETCLEAARECLYSVFSLDDEYGVLRFSKRCGMVHGMVFEFLQSQEISELIHVDSLQSIVYRLESLVD